MKRIKLKQIAAVSLLSVSFFGVTVVYNGCSQVGFDTLERQNMAGAGFNDGLDTGVDLDLPSPLPVVDNSPIEVSDSDDVTNNVTNNNTPAIDNNLIAPISVNPGSHNDDKNNDKKHVDVDQDKHDDAHNDMHDGVTLDNEKHDLHTQVIDEDDSHRKLVVACARGAGSNKNEYVRLNSISKHQKSELCVEVCHLPAGHEEKAKTLLLPINAASAHVGHGDELGSCESQGR